MTSAGLTALGQTTRGALVTRGSALEAQLARQIQWTGLPEPVREFRFAPPRQWRVDFAWPDRLIAAEVEGGQWVSGRHTRGSGFEADCEKYNAAVLCGWRVLRVTGGMIRRGEALTLVERALGVKA